MLVGVVRNNKLFFLPAATCHPNRPRRVKSGFCESCYKKSRMSIPAVLDRKNQKQREWCKRNADKCKIWNKATYLKIRYKLSQEEYDTMYQRQGGRCAICREKRRLNVEHNHETGEVRGLCCHRCNTAIAWLENHTSAMWRYIGGGWREELQ